MAVNPNDFGFFSYLFTPRRPVYDGNDSIRTPLLSTDGGRGGAAFVILTDDTHTMFLLRNDSLAPSQGNLYRWI
jgi:hypothetical protein